MDGYITLMDGSIRPIQKSGHYDIICNELTNEVEVRHERLSYMSSHMTNTVKVVTNGVNIAELVLPKATEALEIYDSVDIETTGIFGQRTKRYGSKINSPMTLPKAIKYVQIPLGIKITNLGDFKGNKKVDIRFRIR